MDDCCGDKLLDDFEECDDGSYNGDDEVCTPQCKHATCGDGFVLANVEACDGGDSCTPECTLKTCGNGTVEPYEWCEKVRPDDQECTNLCTDARKVMFLTSDHYSGGEIGGTSGGNEKCQGLADDAGLDGEFRAWLGTSEQDVPATFWDWAKVPYVNVNGDVLISSKYDLCEHEWVLLDETGAAHPGSSEMLGNNSIWAWWMHDWLGLDTDTCAGWSKADSHGTAFQPLSCSMSDDVPCMWVAPIICVEQ